MKLILKTHRQRIKQTSDTNPYPKQEPEQGRKQGRRRKNADEICTEERDGKGWDGMG